MPPYCFTSVPSNTIFVFFTSRNDELAKKINGSVGRRVAISYEQHKGLPSNWFGDTDYFAKDVKVLE